MSMTKKDFIALARIIKAARPLPFDQYRGDHAKAKAEGAAETAAYMARELADHCASCNPQFNRERFLTACGVSDAAQHAAALIAKHRGVQS